MRLIFCSSTQPHISLSMQTGSDFIQEVLSGHPCGSEKEMQAGPYWNERWSASILYMKAERTLHAAHFWKARISPTITVCHLSQKVRSKACWKSFIALTCRLIRSGSISLNLWRGRL